MIASVSSSSTVALLRPIAATSGDSQSQESVPTNTAAPTTPSIESKPTLSPRLNVVAATSDSEESGTSTTGETGSGENTAEETQSQPAATTGNETEGADGEALTQEEQAQLAKLRARDREVRAHEQAHAAAGAGVAGAPSYSFQQGPDGKQYAVGGEVSVRTNASSGNPRQAIAQLQQVARAALAPASPSGQDRAVAASARAQAAQLQAQLAAESQAKAQEALQGGAENAQAAAADQGAPAESKPLLPELPRVAVTGIKPTGGDTEATPRRGANSESGSVVQPIAASVIAPPEKKSSTSDLGGASESGSGIASSIAAYQQQVGAANGGHNSNRIKPITPSLGGIISLNA